MTERTKVDIAVPLRSRLGEGPVWLAESGALVWLDIVGRGIHRFSANDRSVQTVALTEMPGAIAPRAKGGFVVATESGFRALDEDVWKSRSIDRHVVQTTSPGSVPPPTGGWRANDAQRLELPLLCSVETDRPDNRMNDGKCDRRGRFWAGTMAMKTDAPKGTLYRFDIDHQAIAVVPDVTISNGLAFHADDRVMYYIDTPTGRVDAFDFDLAEGKVSNRRSVVEIARPVGAPDGMTIDTDGCLWVALWGGAAVHRYTPEGRLDRVIEVPAARVTSCTFGGATLDELYITTACVGATEAEMLEQPDAGAVFICRPGASGLPTDSFGG